MINLKNLSDLKLAIIGLGYVGLPLAVEFGKRRTVVGFDINQQRIDQLNAGHDATLETEPEELIAAKQLNSVTALMILKIAVASSLRFPPLLISIKDPI